LGLGNVTNASIAAAGTMAGITATTFSDSRLLAGANLVSDSEFGGAGAAADTFTSASIGKLKVTGQITDSVIGAGLDPADGTIGNGNDRAATGGAGTLTSVAAAGADESTRFLAGRFGKAKLGAKVDPATDARFKVLT
jgi:hypothetical protein